MEIEYKQLFVRATEKEQLLDLNTHGSQGWIICGPIQEPRHSLVLPDHSFALVAQVLFYRVKPELYNGEYTGGPK
jgi:hypothetical protein